MVGHRPGGAAVFYGYAYRESPLERAFAAGVPAVVEVMVERKYPLSGSPAVGWWDVPVPTYLTKQRARYDRERAEEH